MGEHFFTVICRQFPVNPAPEIQLSIMQVIGGVDTYLNGSKLDIFTRNITEIEQSLSVSGLLSLSDGPIKIICEVSNINGNDSATTFVKFCSKLQ